MKNKKAKKGFTLVELLVVITILAVLATVSVIGYRSFTKKAQVSNDTSLVAQLNIALKANEATDGKPQNPTEALEVVGQNGFDVEKLTPTTSKYNIVWNQEANEFALLNEKDETVFGNATKDYKTWKFLDAYVEGTEYSVYLKGTSVTGELKNVKAGLDVGKNTGITKISFNDSADAKSVIVRTNGGTLEIDAEKDTIHHYGYVGTLSVKAVSSENCYHEHGFVGTLEKFAKGKLVVSSTAEFHQREDVIEELLTASGATYENLGATYGSHHFEDGACTICDKGSSDVNVKLDSVEKLITNISELGEEYDGTVKYSLSSNLAFSKDDVVTQPRRSGMLIDLNGNTLTLYNSKYDETEECFTSGLIVRGYFEIIDSSASKTGKIIASSDTNNNGTGGLITVEKSGKQAQGGTTNAEVVLSNGTIDSTNNKNGCAIMMWHGGAVTVNGGTIKAKSYAISGSTHDDSSHKNGRLVINNGDIISDESYAIYHPQHINENANGSFNISGGTIKGKLGAISLGGNTAGASSPTAGETGLTVRISGGKFISEGENLFYVNSTYLKSSTLCKIWIRITGGTFEMSQNGYFANIIADKYVNKNASEKCYFYLSGGMFTNISQTDFIYKLNFASKTAKGVEKTATAKERLSNGFQIEPSSDSNIWSVVAKSK